MEERGLTQGWEPGLDVGDTVVRRQIHNLAERVRYSARQSGGPLVDNGDFVANRLCEGSHWANDVVLLRPFGEGEIHDLVARLRVEVPWEGKIWSAWPTPDLREHGCELFSHPPAMFRAPGGQAPPLPEGCEIIEVRDAEELRDYDHTAIRGFPLNRSDHTPLPALLRPEFVGGPWRFFIAYVEGEPVSVASVFVACGVAQVEWVATLREHRGKGYGEAVTWAATLAEPEVPAVLVSSDEGRPVYERMGYFSMSRFTMWHWKGQGG